MTFIGPLVGKDSFSESNPMMKANQKPRLGSRNFEGSNTPFTSMTNNRLKGKESPAVQIEQNRLSANLSNDYYRIQSSLQKDTESVERSLNNVIKMLPMSMLKEKNNPIKIQQRNKALALVLSTYNLNQEDFLYDKFCRWRQISIILTKKQAGLERIRRQAAATVINRSIRTFLSRCKLFHLVLKLTNERKEKELKEKLWKEKMEKGVSEEEKLGFIAVIAGTMIRFVYRKRRKKAREIRQKEAVNCIILAFRNFSINLKIYHAEEKDMKNRQMEAVLIIQCEVRSYFARKKLDKLRTLGYRKNLQNRYETDNGVASFYYEQHGAAFTIQNWYLNLKWYKKKMDIRKFKKWELRIYGPALTERTEIIDSSQSVVKRSFSRKLSQATLKSFNSIKDLSKEGLELAATTAQNSSLYKGKALTLILTLILTMILILIMILIIKQK
jgi:hypothetical protein